MPNVSIAGKYFEISRIDTNATDWKDVVVPISCHRVVIENSDLVNTLNFRTREGGPMKNIPQGQELDIDAEVLTFNPGDIIGQVQSSAGTGPAIVTFTR